MAPDKPLTVLPTFTSGQKLNEIEYKSLLPSHLALPFFFSFALKLLLTIFHPIPKAIRAFPLRQHSGVRDWGGGGVDYNLKSCSFLSD
jgi:hypothetical protein